MVYDSTFTIVRWGDVHQLITSTGAPHFLSERGWADGRDVARRGRTSMTKIEAGMMTFPIFLGKYKSHVPGKPPGGSVGYIPNDFSGIFVGLIH